jgi:hypothetical protein
VYWQPNIARAVSTLTATRTPCSTQESKRRSTTACVRAAREQVDDTKRSDAVYSTPFDLGALRIFIHSDGQLANVPRKTFAVLACLRCETLGNWQRATFNYRPSTRPIKLLMGRVESWQRADAE